MSTELVGLLRKQLGNKSIINIMHRELKIFCNTQMLVEENYGESSFLLAQRFIKDKPQFVFVHMGKGIIDCYNQMKGLPADVPLSKECTTIARTLFEEIFANVDVFLDEHKAYLDCVEPETIDTDSGTRMWDRIKMFTFD